jgi:uncharacterized BrkB/YihY/UPF0761 family membrane protein
MSKTIRVEKRQRGFFGWVFLTIFWLFNAFMVLATVLGVSSSGEVIAGATTDAQQAGAAIGTAIGLSMILSLWMAGAVILGLFVLLTRGKKVTIETTVE